MMERIINLLKSDKEISDYRVNAQKRESYELFFVHKKLETVRSTDTTDLKATVFMLHDGKLGDATFSVYASDTDAALTKKIEAAKKKALLINNEPYPLPEGETGSFESESNFKEFSPHELAAKIADAVFAADSYENGALNATEIFVYRDTVSVKNSRGIDKSEVKHHAMVEAIPTWNGSGESVELYECYSFGELDAEAIRTEIDTRMKEVRDRIDATAPKEKLSCPVYIPAAELYQLVANLAMELTFDSAYKHMNAFEVGGKIQKSPTGDKLTLSMMGSLKGCVGSAAFDSDGLTAKDTEVIKDGVAEAMFGSVRYAHYLGKEPTGRLRCIRTECGTLTDEELSRAPYFRIASMSGMQIDIYNDYIGGEVRLAYYFDGEREIPVTSVSISGKLSEALSSMRLSDTETLYESYVGPKGAAFYTVDIV